VPPKVRENYLAFSGLDEHSVGIGDVFQIGSAVFSVTTPRMPCFKLGIKMKDPGFVRDFMQARRTGFYFKVRTEGTIEAGDEIIRAGTDGYGLTVDEVVRLYGADRRNAALLEKAIHSPSLPADWKEFFQKRLRQIQG
jgi:MOSC domain-containing protein YiiM